MELPEDEQISDEEDVEVNANNALDPRAGFVDVVLPQLNFNPKQIVDLLEQHKFLPGSTSKSRKTISNLITM